MFPKPCRDCVLSITHDCLHLHLDLSVTAKFKTEVRSSPGKPLTPSKSILSLTSVTCSIFPDTVVSSPLFCTICLFLPSALHIPCYSSSDTCLTTTIRTSGIKVATTISDGKINKINMFYTNQFKSGTIFQAFRNTIQR